jgi:predicted ATPase
MWEEHRTFMSEVLAEHDRILRDAIESCGGTVFSTGGDGLAAAFQSVPGAVEAALNSQARLQGEAWDPPLLVRMALHTGEVEHRAGDYFGPPLNRCARLMSTAHGGQVVLSAVTSGLAADRLPPGASLVDLGQHRLRDLSEPEHVFQLLHPTLRADFPALRSLDVYPGNLPSQPSSFVGRDALLAEAAKVLAESRILTLSGVGGVGKTRAALQVAAELVPSFRDGAWLVELAPVSSADGFEDAIATALGVRPRPGTPVGQCVTEFLRDKQILLVLDNCEHLLDATAAFVDRAVRASTELKVLATSREGLSVEAERIMTVPSLTLPGPGQSAGSSLETEAVQLFVERAVEADSGFRFGADNAQAIAELCRRLDGVPLAVELAAARVGGMTPSEIARHLDRRFQLLSRGRRTATTRHQALRNTIDWSYDLLSEKERVVLRRLAVFAGDFDGEAAGEVVPHTDLESFEVLDLLVRLVEKSLVAANRSGKSTRYRLLETIRDYAWERLEAVGELDAAAERHARYYVDLAVKVGAGLESADELACCERVQDELENFRASLRWAIDNDEPDAAFLLMDALMPVSWLRSQPFGAMTRDAADMPGAGAHPLRAMALGMACQGLTEEGAIEEALRYADATELETKRLLDGTEHARLRCRTAGCLTTAIALSGQNSRLVSLARRGLSDARTAGDRFQAMRFLIMLSSAIDEDRRDEAIRLGEEGLELAREFGVPSYLAWAPMMLAGRLVESDPSRAEALLGEATAAAARADNPFARYMAALQLASVQAVRGHPRDAAATILEQLSSGTAQGGRQAMLQALSSLVPLLVSLGDVDTALLVGAWAESRGVRWTEMNPTYGRFAGDAYLALRSDLSEDHKRSLTARAAEVDDATLVDLVRRSVAAEVPGSANR